jgi:hypothetical protein
MSLLWVPALHADHWGAGDVLIAVLLLIVVLVVLRAFKLI